GLGLRDLVLVVRKHEVDAAGVDVQGGPEVAPAHRRALDVPPGTAAPERRVPRGADLFIAGLRLLPQREVADRLLVVLVRRDAGTGLEPGTVEMRQLAVFRKARDPEVDVPVGDV